MSVFLTELHHEMLRVLLEKGADTAPVVWIRLALRVKGAGQILDHLRDQGLVDRLDWDVPNPRFQLTAAGVAEARKAVA